MVVNEKQDLFNNNYNILLNYCKGEIKSFNILRLTFTINDIEYIYNYNKRINAFLNEKNNEDFKYEAPLLLNYNFNQLNQFIERLLFKYVC